MTRRKSDRELILEYASAVETPGGPIQEPVLWAAAVRSLRNRAAEYRAGRKGDDELIREFMAPLSSWDAASAVSVAMQERAKEYEDGQVNDK